MNGSDTPAIVTPLLLVGIAVVTPLALRLLGVLPTWPRRVVLAVGVAAGAVATLLPTGALAACLAGIDVLAVLTVGAMLPEVAQRARPESLLAVLVLGYLLIGSMAICVWRSGIDPLSVGPTISELTAVHFHYAGVGALTIAVLTYRALAGRRGELAAAAGIAGVAVGPALVAAGFAVWRPLLAVGAVVLAGGVLVVSAVTLLARLPGAMWGPQRLLLTCAALAPVLPMFLAADYGLAQVAAVPALTISEMALWHGTINALGFVLCGLLGCIAWSPSDASVSTP